MRYLTLLLLLVGCVTPTPPTPIYTPPFPLPSSSSLTVSAPDSLLINMNSILGPANTISVERAVNLTLSGTNVTIPAGCKFSYVTQPTSSVFTFTDPKPKVQFRGLSPILDTLHFLSDTTGEAHLHLGPVPITHRFQLLPEAATSSSALPTMWWWGDTASCKPCRDFDNDSKAAKDLPFQLVHNPPGVACPFDSVPSFAWHKTNALPSSTVKENYRLEGYTTLKHLVDQFNKTRKPTTGHTHKCERCSTVWSHLDNDPNVSHNCPKCGKTEFVINSTF